MSDSSRLLGLQHSRPPCPSPAPRVYSNACPLSRWCHPTISSSVIPFASCLQSFPTSESFPMSQEISTFLSQSLRYLVDRKSVRIRIEQCHQITVCSQHFSQFFCLNLLFYFKNPLFIYFLLFLMMIQFYPHHLNWNIFK